MKNPFKNWPRGQKRYMFGILLGITGGVLLHYDHTCAAAFILAAVGIGGWGSYLMDEAKK